MLRDLNPHRYNHRSYVISSGDLMSIAKAEQFELDLRRGTSKDGHGSYDVSIVPRARNIHQALWSTPLSCLRCFLACVQTLFTPHSIPGKAVASMPDLVLTNGPATATIMIFAARFVRLSYLGRLSSLRCIYVESWARVKTFSLSAKVICATGVCDKVLVQWPGLATTARSQRAWWNWYGLRTPDIEDVGWIIG